jgi:hypothetical protein
MLKLLDAINELVKDQHFEKVQALALKIKDSDLETPHTLNQFFSTSAANTALTRVLTESQRLACSSEALGGLILGASSAFQKAKSAQQVQLVWTGPDMNQVPVRNSAQVLLDLINSAETSLYLISFVLVNVPKIESALSDAIDRGVDVRLLLESEDKDGSGDFRQTLERLRQKIPGLSLYYWPRENRENSGGGFARVHAKCAVADGANAFLTSANLTSAALDKNIEMGVCIDDGNIPTTIQKQFISMIRVKEILPFNSIRTSPASTTTFESIDQLPKSLSELSRFRLKFSNTELDIEEDRGFSVVPPDGPNPKMNAVVIIRDANQWRVGKYAWSKQQENEGGRIFYLVTVRGFGPTASFEIEEQDWVNFKPAAVENQA